MEKLNELVALAKKATQGEWSQSPYDTRARFCAQVWDSEGMALLIHDGKGEKASNDVAFIAAANPTTIIAIYEAFRALEQRAEAAEAKLAEYEADISKVHSVGRKHGLASMQNGYLVATALAERPAPAADLSELVPSEIPREVYKVIYDQCGGFVDTAANAQTIWEACRAAILRNIEEAK